ncbi:MAG: peptidoglycan-associated lipoprotein Pal [Candidatus Obscuribacterales bacterium]|nr:peptidoglycan-associated lipoprotein Pal [Steroidobacteraceae bacterium]
MRIAQLALILVTVTVLTGCPKKVTTVPDAPADTSNTSSTGTSGVTNTDTTGGSQLPGDQAALQELQRLGMTIYFDYDKAEIKPEYVNVVAAHAKFLNGNTARVVRLEGHTDERGSREYNIGLGERRGQTVRRALMLQGVGEAQITTVSYGEERQAAGGSDEEAYAKNRRVEIGYGR